MAARRTGLGRGLEALIPQAAVEGGIGFRMIPVGEISPNPHQPRTTIDDEALEALAASIREVGILQPVVVHELPEGGYELVAGERRWRAAQLAGLSDLPAVVRVGDDVSSLTEALIENVQREDLTPLETAAAYRQLMDDFGLTHEAVARRVGKSRAAVSNTIRLLQLSPAIQGLLAAGRLTAGHARPLIGLEDVKFAEHVAKRAASEGWSVRQVEDAVRLRTAKPEGGAAPGPTRQPRRPRPDAILGLEQQLSERLGTPVRIDYRDNRGKLVVRFSSLEELERIYRLFLEG